MPSKSPSELARETLRLLAVRKLPPTPEHFSAIFQELAGPDSHHVERSASQAAAAQPMQTSSTAASPIQVKATVGAVDAPVLPAEQRNVLLAEFLEQIARLIEFMLPALGEDDAKIGPEAAALVALCRAPILANTLGALRPRFANFNQRLSFVAEEQAEFRVSLLGLVRLVFENISELSLDDRWLHEQVQLLLEASQPPISLRRLDDLERRLKDIIFKQGELKQRMLSAQEDTKHLLATFIDRLSDMARMTGAQSQRMEECARQIDSARDLAAIGPALNEMISATRMLSLHSLQTHEELASLRARAQASDSELASLREQLDQVASANRHDVLTGVLNRRGLEEALERELPRVRAHGSVLSVAMLDIDNFKNINDLHGHLIGDAALNHLVDVAREVMRPQDTLSRYGGEEFVILLPDTQLFDAVVVIQQLQRELTRHFFMAGERRILITFSAGVAAVAPGELAGSAIERADKAMYQAKRSGKNKVVAT